jgi:phage-related protein
VDYTITCYSKAVQEQIFELPDTLAARYVVLTRRMVALGPNLGEPHTRAFGDGLSELRLKGAEGMARVLYSCWQTHRHAAQLYQKVGTYTTARASNCGNQVEGSQTCKHMIKSSRN